MAPYAYRCDGLGKRAGPANLNDMIYAASREVSHPLPPVRDLAIVDHMVGAEGADTFHLLVRRRGGDNRRTRHLRDLQRGDGNTAGALRHQHPTVSGREAAIGDQQVVVIERGRVQRDPDLARPGLTRVRDVVDLDPIQPARRTKDCSFHYDLPLCAATTRPSSQS